VVIPHHSWRK